MKALYVTWIFWIACFFILPIASGQTRYASIDSLTINEAVKLALENHPALQAANANVRAASAASLQALSSYFPSVNATAAATRTYGWFVLNPQFPARNQSYNNYTTGIQATQTVFDFGKTINRVSANSSLEEASVSDFEATRGNVITNVQVAYYGVIQAIQVVKVNQEAVDRAAQHLAQAKAFYSVGKRAQFDVTRAEVDLANANVNAIRSRNQLQLAKLQLDNAIGIHTKPNLRVNDLFNIEPLQISLDSIKSMTISKRPELLAARNRLAANHSLVSAAWDQNLPTLSASGNYTWSNFYFPLLGRWNAGLTLSLPIFQGMAISAQVAQAQAALDAAQANLDQLTESVMLEVEQYYLSVKESEERIAAATKLVEQSEENLNLAERQYTAGVGTTIEVTDAQLNLSNARITKIQALYDYNTYFTRLKRAMGW